MIKMKNILLEKKEFDEKFIRKAMKMKPIEARIFLSTMINDKKLKSAIKRIAKKDRKKGLLLMNFYKKHWVEFMIKSKQALGESILNEGEKERCKRLCINQAQGETK